MGYGYLLMTYGYLAIAAGTFVEGETMAVMGGFAVHRGYLTLSLVMLATFIGGIAGDQFYFLLGRLKGKAYLERHPSWNSKVERVHRLLDRYNMLVLVGFRFVYGIRTITPFVIGMSGISTLRFIVLNGIGALIWSIMVVLLGYFFGVAVEAVFADIKRYEHMFFIGLLCCGTIFAIVYFARKHRR